MLVDSPVLVRAKRRKVFLEEGLALERLPHDRGMYHCNYCGRDISSEVRIKCGACTDFDLCLSCFSVGAEITPHKNQHPYRIVGNLSFPLYDGSWGADEELLLLEALDNHGPGNWGVIADVVGSKSQQQCMQHYLKIFIHHENYPLPLPTKEIESMDLQEVAKKVRESTRLSSDVNKAVLQGVNCPQIKADCYNNDSFTSRNQEYIKQNSRKRSQQELLDEEQPEGSYINPKMKFISNSMKKKKQQISLPKLLPDQHPIDSTGYNKFRQEFEPDYDLEAEAIVAEIEISPLDDVQIDLQVNSIDDKLKERLLQIYHRRQEARKQRGEGILSRIGTGQLITDMTFVISP